VKPEVVARCLWCGCEFASGAALALHRCMGMAPLSERERELVQRSLSLGQIEAPAPLGYTHISPRSKVAPQ